MFPVDEYGSERRFVTIFVFLKLLRGEKGSAESMSEVLASTGQILFVLLLMLNCFMDLMIFDDVVLNFDGAIAALACKSNSKVRDLRILNGSPGSRHG